MTTDPIPAEAVEAAARAMSVHWRDMHTNEALGRQRMLAEAALTAAAPYIAAQAETDLRAGIEALRDEWRVAGDGSNSEGRAFRHCARALDVLDCGMHANASVERAR